MAFDDKLRAAFEVLAKTDMTESTYAPPIYKLLWKLSFKIRPPHFATWRQNALLMGTFFGLFWSLGFWAVFGTIGASVLSVTTTPSKTTLLPTYPSLVELVFLIILSGLTAGFLFGRYMAIFFETSARKYNLPDWDTL